MSIAVDEIFRVSGVIFSRTNTRSLINGIAYSGIKTVDASDKREGEIVFGQRTSGQPLGITEGVYQCDDWNMELLIDTYQLVAEQLAITIGANGSIGSSRFSYMLSFVPPQGVVMPTLSMKLSGCKVEKRAFGVNDDTGASVVKIGGKAMSLVTVGEGVGLTGIPAYLENFFAV